MKSKQFIYLILSIAGTALPCWQLFGFLREHGLNADLMIKQLFANNVSGFFGLDVIVSSVVLWVFVYSEGTRLKMRNLWVYVLANLAVGVSLALPLFLLVRESSLDETRSTVSS